MRDNILASVKLTEDDVFYLFHSEFQRQSFHSKLFKINALKNATKQSLKGGQYRKINVNFPDLLVPIIYVDGHSNNEY